MLSIVQKRRGLSRPHPNYSPSTGTEGPRGSTPHVSGRTDFPRASYTLVVCKHSGYDCRHQGLVGLPALRASVPAPGTGPRVQLMIKGGHPGVPGLATKQLSFQQEEGSGRGPHRSTLPSRPSKPFPTHCLTFLSQERARPHSDMVDLANADKEHTVFLRIPESPLPFFFVKMRSNAIHELRSWVLIFSSALWETS